MFLSQALTDAEYSIKERSGNMTRRENTVPTANNWADDIDDLNREAMEKYLLGTFCPRTWGHVSRDGVAEEKVAAANLECKETSA